jgi:hypothetical protein
MVSFISLCDEATVNETMVWQSCYNSATMRTGFVERKGKINELDRFFDLAF